MKFSRDRFFFLLLMHLSVYQVKADTLTVCPDCQVRSLVQAIKESRSGDCIFVMGGVYSEGKIDICKRVSLIGFNYPQIVGNDSTDIFLVNADSVIIRGFHIRDIGKNYVKDLAGIKINGRLNCRIEENKLDNTFFGIYLKNARQCIIKGNTIIGKAENELSSGNAIHLWYSSEIEISSNLCRNHRDGIYLEFVDNSMIIKNISEGNLRYGLHFMFSNHDEYFNNTFRKNGAGVAVMFSHFINMRENIFEENWGPSAYGLLLKDIYDGDIRNNVFSRNTFGIYADGSNRINIQYNDFNRNGWAIKILGSCAQNTIRENNFIGNSFDIITNSASNTNLYTRNFWSDYTGYDLDRDGVGDVPYHPVKLFSYVVTNVPSSIILLRSTFVDLVNLAEKVAPTLTPKTLADDQPLMNKINNNGNK